jgi:hypothetical protein
MRRLATTILSAWVTFGTLGCSLFQAKVTLSLNPSAVLTIQSQGAATTGQTGTPIQVSPAADGGTAYTSNKSKITDAKLTSITFDVAKVYSDNMATALTMTTVTLKDTVTGSSATFTLQAPVQKINAVGTSNSFTAFTPDPSPFLEGILKSGDDFTVSATATIDQAPVHIDVKVDIAASVTVNVL